MPSCSAKGTSHSGWELLITSAAVSTAALQRLPAKAHEPVNGKRVPILMIFSWAKATPVTKLNIKIIVRKTSKLFFVKLFIYSSLNLLNRNLNNEEYH